MPTEIPQLTPNLAQPALRFAVVPDYRTYHGNECVVVSIRFKVRGGFRPYPLARRPDKPCCGGFTHHPSSPLQQADKTCPKWGKTPSQVPYTPETVFGRSPTPLSEGVSKIPSRRELGVFVGVYLGPGSVPRRGIRPRARSGLLFGRR